MVAARYAEGYRRNLILRQLAVAQFHNPGRAADCDFVDSIAAVHDHRAPRSECLERIRHRPDQILFGDAQQMEARARRVAERPHQIEDGANSELASERRNLFERWMIHLREDVTASRGVEASLQPVGIAIDLNA